MKWMFLSLFALIAAASHAEPWLCTDADGNKAYSYEPESAKRKECVHKPIPSPNIWRKASRLSHEGAEGKHPYFPSIDARMQKERDADRRRLLEQELADEKKALSEAMKQLDEQKKASAGEKSAARIEEKLKPYQARVRLHLTNIENLEKELAGRG